MCAMSNCEHPQSYHKTIIKEVIDYRISQDSACISSDEDNDHISSAHTGTPRQRTILRQSDSITKRICGDDNTEFPECTGQTADLAFRIIHPERRLNSGGFHFPSPSPPRRMSDEQNTSTVFRRSRSLDNLSHATLEERLTADSGTGDLVEHLPTVQSSYFQEVRVYGQPQQKVLLQNRFEIDHRKINDYQKQKGKNILTSWLFKPSTSTRKPASASVKIDTNESRGIFSRLFKTPKQPPVESCVTTPYCRHHLSQRNTDNNN